MEAAGPGWYLEFCVWTLGRAAPVGITGRRGFRTVSSARTSEVDLAGRVARLTAGQRECLDLVDDHATSKEIARQLGISRHTVDARLRGAIQTLGVTSRREAAIIYRTAMQAAVQAGAYQSFTYQPPRIAAAGADVETSLQQLSNGDFDDAPGATPPDIRQTAAAAPAYAAAHVADSAVWTSSQIVQVRPPQPFLRLWGGANDLSPAQRLAGIMVVMILAMLAFGIFLSGIEALTLLRS